MEQTRKNYWFKARRYGWGWTPVTWQAWFLIAIYMLVVTGAAVMLLPSTKSEPANIVGIVAFVLIFLSATFLLIGISMLKGERPGWRWNDKNKND